MEAPGDSLLEFTNVEDNPSLSEANGLIVPERRLATR